MNKDIMKQVGFGKHVKSVEAGKCPFCKLHVNAKDFKNEISKKEFGISGLCQKCQDEFFGSDD